MTLDYEWLPLAVIVFKEIKVFHRKAIYWRNTIVFQVKLFLKLCLKNLFWKTQRHFELIIDKEIHKKTDEGGKLWREYKTSLKKMEWGSIDRFYFRSYFILLIFFFNYLNAVYSLLTSYSIHTRILRYAYMHYARYSDIVLQQTYVHLKIYITTIYKIHTDS